MSETATKSRPILFSGPMVRAILDGRKTQTRRVGAIQNPDWTELGTHYSTHATKGDEIVADYRAYPGQGSARHSICACPYGQPGDELWVRETWAETESGMSVPIVAYRAGGAQVIGATGDRRSGTLAYSLCGDYSEPDFDVELWRPSIFMPRWASRITLTITNVRVERLNEISHADAIAEGCFPISEWQLGDESVTPPRDQFKTLWQSINGAGSWQANPWVWVVEFQRKAGE